MSKGEDLRHGGTAPSLLLILVRDGGHILEKGALDTQFTRQTARVAPRSGLDAVGAEKQVHTRTLPASNGASGSQTNTSAMHRFIQ